MAIRLIDIPSLGRRLANLMAGPSSADPDQHDAGLDAYLRMGGNCLHLHGEGGETHSRRAGGAWLNRHQLRSEFFVCTQICHDAWDEVKGVAVDRFDGAAVQVDIAADLELTRTDHLDLVYLDDSPDRAFEPVLDAIAHARQQGMVRAFGVRNWSPQRIRAADAYLRASGQPGIAAIVTTELSLARSTAPLWPGYIPFDDEMRGLAIEMEFAVFAHLDDFTIGQYLFEEADAQPNWRPEWVARWRHPSNDELVHRVTQIAQAIGASARQVNLAYALT